MTQNTINAVAILLSSLSFFVALFLLYFRVIKERRHYEWEKKVKALSYSLTRNAQVKEARLALAEKYDIGNRTTVISYQEIVEHCKSDNSVRPHIIDILGHWENMSLAIAENVVDEDIAFKMIHSTLIQYTYVFKEFINHRRNSNPRAYEFLIQIAQKWQKTIASDQIKIKQMNLDFDEDNNNN